MCSKSQDQFVASYITSGWVTDFSGNSTGPFFLSVAGHSAAQQGHHLWLTGSQNSLAKLRSCNANCLHHYAIWGLIRRCRRENKTSNLLKGCSNLIQCQKETFGNKTSNLLKGCSNLIQCQKEAIGNSSIPDEHISKSNHLDSEMLNLVSECAQYVQKTSIHQLSIYKTWNHLVCVHGTPPIKFWLWYLWQISFGCSQKHLILITVLRIISRVDSDGAVNT